MYSYSYEPLASPLDWVRFEVQDTDPEAPLLEDGEITAAIIQEAGDPTKTAVSEGGLLRATARLMEILSRRFGLQADTVTGSLAVDYSKQQVSYAAMAKALRLRAQGMSSPWAGGQSESEKQSQREQEDRVQPAFQRQQFAVPQARQSELNEPSRTVPI